MYISNIKIKKLRLSKRLRTPLISPLFYEVWFSAHNAEILAIKGECFDCDEIFVYTRDPPWPITTQQGEGEARES